MDFLEKVLSKWGFSSLLESFIEQEFNEESFRALDYETLKDVIPKAGPRLLFWQKFKAEFQLTETESVISTATTVSNSSSAFAVSSDILPNDINESFSTSSFSHILSPLECFNASDSERTFTNTSLNDILKYPSSLDSPLVVTNKSNPVCGPQNFIILPPNIKSTKQTIEDYLKCPNGTIIKKYFDKNNSLNASNRNKLASVIVHKEIGDSENPKISTERFIELSKGITELFPSENISTYYIKYNNVSKRLARGKLWESYNHLKRRLKKNSLNTIKQNSNDQDNQDGTLQEKLNYLKGNLDDEQRIKQYWTETRNYRLEIIKSQGYEIGTYFETFICLKSQLGANLLMTDFDVAYPNVKNFLISWDSVNAKLIKYGGQHGITTSTYLKNDNELSGLIILSLIFKSSIYIKKNANGKRTRLSGAEVLNSLLYLVPGLCDLQNRKDRLEDELRKTRQRFQPAVFLVGATYDNIESSYVFVNDVLFNFDSPLKAVDACLKITNALHAKYSENCEPIWLFLQKYVYEFTTQWDKSFTKLNSLISDLS